MTQSRGRKMRSTIQLFLLGVAVVALVAPQPAGSSSEILVIETVAGTGDRGFSGDGGDAIAARLNEPSGVAVDGAGNIYIADNDNNRIRRVDREGKITTVAGTGKSGFSGDSGPATEAELNNPYGVWVSASGEVYIADQRNHRVRKVSQDGVIETIAGNGVSGYSGDGGPATEASLSYPDDMVLNSEGELFIADAGNDVVRRILVDGSIDTFAGSGKHAYNGASAHSGDGGPATLAQLDTPAALAIDPKGNLYIADLRNHAIRKVSTEGVITTIAGTGRAGFNGDRRDATKAMLDEPGGVAIDKDGSLLIAEGGNWRVRRLARDGSIKTIAGNGTEGFSGDGGDAGLAQFSTLDFVAIGPQGEIYVADYGNHTIRVLKPGTAEERGGAEVERLLMRMRDAYARVDHARLETRERRLTPSGWSVREGMVEYWGDSRLRARFSIPDYGEVEVESDGFKITVRDATRSGPDVMRYDAGNLNRALLGNLEVYSFYDAFRQLSTAAGGFMSGSSLEVRPDMEWAGRSWTVLEETAGDLKVEYFVDPSSHLIWRTVQRDSGSDEIRYEGYLASMEF